ncbi:FAD-dependent monooxygenase [Nonomuraea pusilla]|uniref:2-polyprenyl-6-methoxyphenol hydroxylase n=1 Tax=Nonomuraea pusilla TaxID=46177 RepID=A0A1H7P438_9ACTN|nr:FAD-dependent monooxygenase [Nonomuraea pusilla]SEL30620.1 2-polyprenyl-6-methoxyphenol hydroxylase [Nonomuraea pusilla]
MKISCVGGGPAGLYFSILMKRMDPSHEVTVYERRPAGSTYGWGVTYSNVLLGNLHSADPESALAIQGSSVRWRRWVHVRDHDAMTAEYGDEGFGIERRALLRILADQAVELGVRVRYEQEIDDEGRLAGADLVVAGDGVNSTLRSRHPDHFGTEITTGRNLYLWLGTTKVLDAFTFVFKETPHGWIWCYGYPYSTERSTCVVECAPDTWRGLGLDRASESGSLAALERIFAELLDGHPLIGRERSGSTAHWLNFRTVANRRWCRGNLVLVGDAAHTTHYSVGSGTSLALEDAAILAHALRVSPRIETALARYERRARGRMRAAQRAARRSAQWYEDFPRYAGLPMPHLVRLLSMRHSRLLPHVPPELYYRLDEAADRTVGRIVRSVSRAVSRNAPAGHQERTPAR